MKSSETSSSIEILCAFCRKGSANKLIGFSGRKSYTVCDACLKIMKVQVCVYDHLRYDILVTVGDAYIHLASTFYQHDPIFAFMVHEIRNEVESARRLLLSV